MDPNREPTLACMTQVDDCFIAFTQYHAMIDDNFKRDFVLAKGYDQSLVLDIHGHTHAEDWVEFGYVLTRQQLNSPSLSPSTMQSSIDNLVAKSPLSMDELVRGDLSLGGILESLHKIKSIPSPKNPRPNDNNYFTGGYISQVHGSYMNRLQPFSAIQIESPSSLRQTATVDDFARKLADAVFQYYLLHSFDK